MKPVRVKNLGPVNNQIPINALDRKLDYLAAVAAVLTVLASLLGLYIAWKNLKTDAATVLVV